MHDDNRKFKRIQLGVVLMLFVFAFAGAVVLKVLNHFSEPRFEGRSLSGWLMNANISEEERARGVRAIGTNGIPLLQEWLLKQPSWAEKQMGRFNRVQHWYLFEHTPSIDANIRSMRGFFILGEDAAPAVPWLTAGLKKRDRDFSFYARALMASGESGREALMEFYPQMTVSEKTQVAHAAYLHMIYDDQLAPFFTRFIADEDPEVSQMSILLCRNLKARCPQVVFDALQKMESSGIDNQREAAQTVIGWLVDKQPQLVPTKNGE